MPALTEPNLVGKRQDLSDMIYLADRKTTPGISSIKKGKPLTNMLYDVIVKSMGARKFLGVPDGKDIGAFDTQNPKVTYQARGVVARRAIMVGFIAEAMAKAGGVAGESSLFDEAEADQLIETKRDMEKALWGNQCSRADDGVNGSVARGMGRWIYEGTSDVDAGRARHLLAHDWLQRVAGAGVGSDPVEPDLYWVDREHDGGPVRGLDPGEIREHGREQRSPWVRDADHQEPDRVLLALYADGGQLHQLGLCDQRQGAGQHSVRRERGRLQERLGFVRAVPGADGFYADQLHRVLPRYGSTPDPERGDV
jgi:hypothetical protein